MTTAPRDLTLDIAKGICILLMVMGHSGIPTDLLSVISTFHMPCFFFISGWLLSEHYIADVRLGIKKKVIGLYWPFVKWFAIFIFLHNFLVNLHILPPPVQSQSEMGIHLLNTLQLKGSQSLLGGFWFLYALFFIAVGLILLLHLVYRMWALQAVRYGILGALLLGLLLVVALFPLIPFTLPTRLGAYLWLSMAFFLSGYLCRKVGFTRQLIQQTSPYWGIAYFVLPVVFALCIGGDLHSVSGWESIAYFVTALSGTLGVLLFSRWCAPTRMATPLVYIGQKTLCILALHFSAFKLVTWLYIEATHRPIEQLTAFPTLHDCPSWLSLLYIVVGIAVPLLAGEVKSFFITRIKHIFNL